jgi:NAD(P)-dependent dehydrogenase (short-subunit alcohol dehydrogenase family)
MLTGRVVLVNGAKGDLGVAVVRELAAAEATIVATARDPTRVEALRIEVGLPGERYLARAADLTDPLSAMALVDAAIARFGSLDILVAATGGWRGGKPIAETDVATLNWLLQINLFTVFNACRAVLPHMLARGWGRIITVGARSAQTGQARSGAYAASKAALVALTQSIAAETRQAGITANTLLPSTIDTSANRAAMPDADYSRWVKPEQIAATIRFLCSDGASAISGTAIPIYGRS